MILFSSSVPTDVVICIQCFCTCSVDYLVKESMFSADMLMMKPQNLQLDATKFFASVSMGEEKPFDFFRTFFGKLKYIKLSILPMTVPWVII